MIVTKTVAALLFIIHTHSTHIAIAATTATAAIAAIAAPTLGRPRHRTQGGQQRASNYLVKHRPRRLPHHHPPRSCRARDLGSRVGPQELLEDLSTALSGKQPRGAPQSEGGARRGTGNLR